MKLNESHDESFYRGLCLDLAFELGLELFRRGGEAQVHIGTPGAPVSTLNRPTSPEFFWEETWFALRQTFGPKAPPRVNMPRSTPVPGPRVEPG